MDPLGQVQPDLNRPIPSLTPNHPMHRATLIGLNAGSPTNLGYPTPSYRHRPADRNLAMGFLPSGILGHV
nr:hypothetical protein Itr_chr07CG08070 [Ipomoea trifida]